METQRNCIWVTHHRSKHTKQDDLLVIKERVKEPNKEEYSNVRYVKNFKRPYWITKKAHQSTHEQKKDWEHMGNLDRYECTQAELATHSAKNLGMYLHNGFAKQSDVNRSPYVYGTDVTSPVIVKNSYRDKWPDYAPAASVAVLDYETDVINDPDDKRVVSGALTFRNKCYLAISQDFVGTLPNPEEKIRACIEKHLSKYIHDRDIELFIKIVPDSMAVIRSCMKAAHMTQPDYVAIWNMVFDINVMIDECERCGIDPADIFCAPEIPKEFRTFRWVEQPKIKRKANGDTMSKDPSELWHRVEAPASFYFIDAMCFYRISRVMQGKINSYSLDAILDRELKLGKLRFDGANGLTGLDWHIKMQMQYKPEYLAYNLFDCISMELLDEKTQDLSVALGSYVGISELKSVPSNPKRLADACHFFLLERNKVICSTSDDMTQELDKHLLSLRNWIITLASELVENTGRSIVEGIPDSESRFSGHCGDIDIASGYPSAGTAMNISGGTTLFEVVGIEGKSEDTQRRNGVDLNACKTNCGQLGRELFDLPSYTDALQYF